MAITSPTVPYSEACAYGSDVEVGGYLSRWTRGQASLWLGYGASPEEANRDAHREGEAQGIDMHSGTITAHLVTA